MNKETYVNVCVDAANHRYRNVTASSITIKINPDGSPYTVKDLLEDMEKQNDRMNAFELKYNDLATKFNALQSAYKANTAKTAMQLLDITENN